MCCAGICRIKIMPKQVQKEVQHHNYTNAGLKIQRQTLEVSSWSSFSTIDSALLSQNDAAFRSFWCCTFFFRFEPSLQPDSAVNGKMEWCTVQRRRKILDLMLQFLATVLQCTIQFFHSQQNRRIKFNPNVENKKGEEKISYLPIVFILFAVINKNVVLLLSWITSSY